MTPAVRAFYTLLPFLPGASLVALTALCALLTVSAVREPEPRRPEVYERPWVSR
jgi:hypothetical protein